MTEKFCKSHPFGFAEVESEELKNKSFELDLQTL